MAGVWTNKHGQELYNTKNNVQYTWSTCTKSRAELMVQSIKELNIPYESTHSNENIYWT